ncbi:hypothetical protein HU200_055767 [Digitaria exilis]|uniref:Uncharacterized protein n=1 Tax=Digitaria exilis TaxID=1010633 RepID=A0A835E6M0_9POAL|nr:hypothetical protein HU200_055767 [Digitaria exilis]
MATRWQRCAQLLSSHPYHSAISSAPCFGLGTHDDVADGDHGATAGAVAAGKLELPRGALSATDRFFVSPARTASLVGDDAGCNTPGPSSRGIHPRAMIFVTLEAPQPSSRGIHPRAVISVTLEAPQPSSRGIHPRAVISVTLEAPQPSSRGIHPRAVISVTLEAPQPSSRGIHPRAAFPSRSRLGRLELAIQARSAWSKRLAQARKLCPTSQTPTFNLTRFEVHAAPARAALAAGKRLPPDTAGCPRSRCTPLTSADSPLAVASPPRTAGFCPRLLRPRVLLFPRPVFSRLAHARLPPAARLRARVDAAHGANTAATSPCRRGSSPSCLSLHLVLPEHPSTPLSRLLKPSTVPSLPRRKNTRRSSQRRRRARSRAQPSPLLPRPNQGSHELPHPPLPLPEPFPTRFPHQSRWRSSPELTELSAAARARAQPALLLLQPNRGHHSLPRAVLVLTDPFSELLRPQRRRSPLAGASRAATAVVDLVPGHPRPQDLAQTNHGEPLSISPHFPGPVSPPFGRLYELVPAAEEIAQESEVNVVHVDPSPEQEYRFEPEGKPRSIT